MRPDRPACAWKTAPIGRRHYAKSCRGVANLSSAAGNHEGRSAGAALPPEPRHYGITLDQCFIAEVSAIADVSAIIEDESIPISDPVMGEASGVADSCCCWPPQPTTAIAMVRDRSATKAKATNLRILVFHLLLIPRPSKCFSERITGVDLAKKTNTTRKQCGLAASVRICALGFPATRRSARTGKRAEPMGRQ